MAIVTGPTNPIPPDQQRGDRKEKSNPRSWSNNPAGIVDRTDIINPRGCTYQEAKLARSASLPARFVRLEFETP